MEGSIPVISFDLLRTMGFLFCIFEILALRRRGGPTDDTKMTSMSVTSPFIARSVRSADISIAAAAPVKAMYDSWSIQSLRQFHLRNHQNHQYCPVHPFLPNMHVYSFLYLFPHSGGVRRSGISIFLRTMQTIQNICLWSLICFNYLFEASQEILRILWILFDFWILLHSNSTFCWQEMIW